MERILLVDNEPKSILLIRQIFSDAGYETISVNNGEKAIRLAAMEQPDLMITDIDLAGAMDGVEAARQVHEFSDMPIIFLSARAHPEDMLRCFRIGADDYITKPFHSKLLLARIKAILKRYQKSIEAPTEPEIICNHLRIDLYRRQLFVDGAEVCLSKTEYKLLLELARNRNKVLFHEQLLTAVWGMEFRDEVDYLRSYIHILRRKIESNPADPKIIISKPGVGYMLVSAV